MLLPTVLGETVNYEPKLAAKETAETKWKAAPRIRRV